MAKPAPISADEKRQAMERVLTSRSLGKSEQLRSFLRYVCEAELEGRAEEINEYALGVVALRRPKEYSPAEDSSVRSRAYELRNRLRAYYETEAPNDPIRIEIPKGGYVPRFLRSPGLAARNDAALASDFRAWTPELRSFWEPFLNSDAPLLIVFEVRLFFFGPSSGLVVRDYQTNDSADLAESRPLAMFRERMEEKELLETLDYTDVGTVHSAFLLGRLLSGTRLSVGLKHSASLDWEDLWNCSVIYVGKISPNKIMRSFLEDKDFEADDWGVVHNAHPLPGEAKEYRSAATHGSGEKYALITRLPGPQPGRHMLLLSGSGAELMWALAESVSNPEHVSEIMSGLQASSGECPPSFQVVIRAVFQSYVPIKIEYVTHRVLPAS